MQSVHSAHSVGVQCIAMQRVAVRRVAVPTSPLQQLLCIARVHHVHIRVQMKLGVQMSIGVEMFEGLSVAETIMWWPCSENAV